MISLFVMSILTVISIIIVAVVGIVIVTIHAIVILSLFVTLCSVLTVFPSIMVVAMIIVSYHFPSCCCWVLVCVCARLGVVFCRT